MTGVPPFPVRGRCPALPASHTQTSLALIKDDLAGGGADSGNPQGTHRQQSIQGADAAGGFHLDVQLRSDTPTHFRCESPLPEWVGLRSLQPAGLELSVQAMKETFTVAPHIHIVLP
jgi:hypothetical protein